MSFVFVALGGALGAVTRYAISLIPVKNTVPDSDIGDKHSWCNPNRLYCWNNR